MLPALRLSIAIVLATAINHSLVAQARPTAEDNSSAIERAQRGDYGEALKALQTLAGTTDQETQGDARRFVSAVLAAIQSRAGSLADRRLAAEATLQMTPVLLPAHQAYAHIVAAGLHEESGDVGAALRGFRAARAVPGPFGDVEATSRCVAMLIASGRVGEAFAELDQMAGLVASEPTDAPPDQDKADDDAVPPSRDEVLLHLRRAELYATVGWIDEASASLSRIDGGAIQSEPLGVLALAAQVLWLDVELWSEQFASAVERADALLDQSGFDQHRIRLARARALDRLRDPRGIVALEELAKDVEAPRPIRVRAAVDRCNHLLRHSMPDAATSALADFEIDESTEVIVALGRLHLATPNATTPAELTAILGSLRDRWRAMLDRWHEVPLRTGGTSFLQVSFRRELLVTLCECELLHDESLGAERCVEHILAADAAATAPRRLTVLAPSLQQLRDQLVGRDGELWCFVPAPGGSLLLRILSQDCVSYTLPGDRGLRPLVQGLRSSLRAAVHHGNEASEIHSRGVAVARSLLGSHVNLLAHSSRVAIWGRELLGGIPFEALPVASEDSSTPVAEPNWPWFGLRAAVSYVSNATVTCFMASAERPPILHDVRVTAPVMSAEVASAHGVPHHILTTPELDGILPQDPPLKHAIAAWEQRLDPADLFDLAERTAVHVLFAHGVYDGAKSCPAGVCLGESGVLFADQTGALENPSPADLVLLCTCGTTQGSLRRGDEGAHHLGTAFLSAGSRVVGVADSDLEVERTCLLVHEFLTALARGEEPDFAMRSARRTMVESGHGSPSEWALLRLEGAASKPLGLRVSTRPMDWTWLILVASAASVALLLITHSRRHRRCRGNPS